MSAVPSAAFNLLYIEDEPDDIFFLREAFRRVGLPPDFRVVEDGQRAISYFAGEGPFANRIDHPLPSTVLLDLNLPQRSGFEVLTWLRSRPEFRDLVVIVFSSSGRPEDRARAHELGATDYCLKPTSGLGFTAIARHLKQLWFTSVDGNP
ncbi:MAG: hypothetical protein RIQ93_2558 [Verrucomicrobiota bacterium]|jgi:CheY-like chemotaxis protein